MSRFFRLPHMDQSLPIFLPLIILPLLMSGFSWLKSFKYKSREFRHLSEFYLSIALVTVASHFLLPLGPAFIILSMLPWIWTLRTFGLLAGDVSGQTLFSRVHFFVFTAGAVISLIFLLFDLSLPFVAAPFCLSIALTGFTFIFQSYARTEWKKYSSLQHFNFVLMLTFFISRLFFPILLSDQETAIYQAAVDKYLLISFCAFFYPLLSEIVFEKQESLLEDVLYTRNKQLFSHSNFSEYKILAAGVSHEVNNALLIINMKIAMLLRGKSKSPDTDLQKIQVATNRIVKAIRGLREFIYPHETQEVLDLGELTNEVQDLYGQRLINHGVDLQVEAMEGKLVKGKRVQLEQIFLSLINNSVDVIDKEEEKWIKITAKMSGDSVEITYMDSGPSRAEEMMPLLSNPLYASEKLEDNDIRLVLVKEIIENHGGTFRTIPDKEFSTFYIRLPLAEATSSTNMNYQSKIEEFKELH